MFESPIKLLEKSLAKVRKLRCRVADYEEKGRDPESQKAGIREHIDSEEEVIS